MANVVEIDRKSSVDQNGSTWRIVKNDVPENISKGKYPKKQSRGANAIKVKGTVSYKREDVTKWNGWGYMDSYFYFKKGAVRFAGNRYPICNTDLPYFRDWLREKFDVHLSDDVSPEDQFMPTDESEYPDPKISSEQLQALKDLDIKISIIGADRLFRSHGQANEDIIHARDLSFERIPDAVIWPECHEDVVEIVRICDKHNIVIIPYGGGTSVSESVSCPVDEARAILSLDSCMMNEILWIDKESLVACCESGIIGQDLERELRKVGYTSGHEPDSIEFSTLGGWVATRASGMKKNAYGNIEDIVVHARMVTPRGVLEKGNRGPRLSCGPDFNHIIIGSEGCFGVITEVTIKIRPLPPFVRYGSLIFPDFDSGVHFMREIARQQCQPASIRLMDNEQFKFGRTFRQESSYAGLILDGLKSLYVTQIKGFNWDKMTVVTILYEGSMAEVLAHERKINAIASQYRGIPAGEQNGKRGYHMTFVIAYIRDVALELNIMAESLETSVPWDRALQVADAVKTRIAKECIKLDIPRFITMCRVAQTYDAGCCLYFYFAISGKNCKDPFKVREYIEERVREDIVALGGSISHHHGVGKVRRKWYEKTVSPTGLDLFRACKAYLDPNNIFATVNFTNSLTIRPCKL